MHFRVRKNVIQLVRTTYDADGKKPHAEVVGRMSAVDPSLSDELVQKLTPEEIAQTTEWIAREQRTAAVRDELAALTLAETIACANRWLRQQHDPAQGQWLAANILPEIQVLRKHLRRFLD